MDVTPLIPKGFYTIRRYGGGKFTVNEEVIEGNILILPQQLHRFEGTIPITLRDWQKDLGEYLAGVELLLLGSGASTLHPPQEIKHWCQTRSIALEAMTTGAACRTYNILLAEGRRVAALLVAV